MKAYLSPTLICFGSVRDLTHGRNTSGGGWGSGSSTGCNITNPKPKLNGSDDGMTAAVGDPGPPGKVLGTLNDAFCGMSKGDLLS